jgi:hypothetical protein
VHLGRARRAFDVGLFALGAAMSTRYRPVENAGERHEGHTANGGGGGEYGVREDGKFLLD